MLNLLRTRRQYCPSLSTCRSMREQLAGPLLSSQLIAPLLAQKVLLGTCCGIPS
jgi:hypothetical protein